MQHCVRSFLKDFIQWSSTNTYTSPTPLHHDAHNLATTHSCDQRVNQPQQCRTLKTTQLRSTTQ